MLTPIAVPAAPEVAPAVLSQALAKLATEGRGTIQRDDAVGAFRRHLARIQAYVRDAFEQDQLTGLQAARLLAGLIDGVIDVLYNHATNELGFNEPANLSIGATGGYGRGVLAPFSDIDLLFLTAEDPSSQSLRVVEYMLYFLWDLGLKVGHATRSIEDCLVTV